nr:Fanconi anemia core complex-associated protein 24 isoform X4 [Loxodonta africana]
MSGRGPRTLCRREPAKEAPVSRATWAVCTRTYPVLFCISLIRAKSPMERTNADDTGPIHVPFGYVVASEKWRGSELAQGLQGKIKLLFEDCLTPVDFYLSSRSCVLYITEADLVAGNGYRKRLVRVRNSSNLQGIILVEKTQMSEQYFPAVQKFTVLDLGMVLLPVASQMEASRLIIQLCFATSAAVPTM